MIDIEDVGKRFGDVVAVDAATLCVQRGEVVALLGPSGCGKTTLLRLVAGFERPDAGSILLAGAPVASPATWVAPEHRRVGMVFQDYALFPHLTVAENVGFGLPRGERRERVPETLALVGLDQLERRFPHELSGGQQQRVALARTLAPGPELVLLDEPWSNIDPHLRQTMRDELAEVLRRAGVTVVLVTHDREEAFSVADRIALMRDGTIVQAGAPETLYLEPADRWAAEFVGSANVLDGVVVGGDAVETPLGRFPARGVNGSRTVVAVVRPELVGLDLDPRGDAVVVERQFRGHDVFYRLRLRDGTLVVSQRPSTELVQQGARVSITPLAGSVSVFSS
jgi:iron(III) transport system ATP-binding protein